MDTFPFHFVLRFGSYCEGLSQKSGDSIYSILTESGSHIDVQCGFFDILPAIAYYKSPVFEVGLFLPRS